MNFVEKIGFTGYEAPPKRSKKNINLKEMLIKKKNQKIVRFKEEQKEIKNKNKGNDSPNFDTRSIIEKRRIKIEKPNMGDYDAKSTYNDLLNYRTKSEKSIKKQKKNKK